MENQIKEKNLLQYRISTFKNISDLLSGHNVSFFEFREKIAKLFNIEKVNSYKVFEIIQSQEKQEEVNKIIEEHIYYLAIGICNLISIFEPDAICIGGSFTHYAPIFMEKLKQKIEENFIGREIPKILTAKFENDAGIIGAAMLKSN